MSASKAIKIVIALGIIGIGIYFFSQLGASESEYVEKVQKERQEKDQRFKNGSDSPLPANERGSFNALNYYEPDPAYRFQVAYEKLKQPEPVEMRMTGNTTERYLKYATVTLDLEGKKHQLFLFQRPTGSTDRSFFLPFTDLTNGYETYGGGRYLDVDVVAPGQVEIDFNDAYSPYCAYNHDYSCPIPPRENHLPVAVKAGEKSLK